MQYVRGLVKVKTLCIKGKVEKALALLAGRTITLHVVWAREPSSSEC